MYSPLVKSRGIEVFHDIVPGSPGICWRLPRIWSEVKGRYRHIEIVKDWSQGDYDIRVLFL